jgi:hypothetical protein
MSLKQKFLAVVSLHGAAVKDHSTARQIVLYVDAPDGKVWKATGCHSVTVTSYRGKGAADYVYQNALDDMENGIDDCDDPECDWCSESGLKWAGDKWVKP